MMAVCTGTVSYLAVNRQANVASAPSSPTNVSLSAGNASITVSWHSPISLGGGSLTNYIIEHRALGAGSWTTNNAAPTATSHTISGLTNDHKYQVRIAAKTASGTSPYTPILLAIPHAAPTISQVNPAADVTPGQTITIQGSGFLPKGKTIVQVASDSVTSLALTSDGAVYSWGGNTHGQLGNGTNTDSNAPFAMQTTGTPMDGKRIVQVISEQVHSLAIADDGTVYAWGDNSSGALGNGTNTGSNIPVAVKTIGTPMEGKAAVYAAAGLGYSLALASDGTVYAWGNNEHGQLGNGTTINSTVSAAVSLTGNSALAPSTPKVTIGGVPATDVTIVDSNTITVKVPAHANGLVDVTVDLGNGDPLYKAVKTNAFRYGPNLATPGSGGAGSANGGNGQHYRGSRTGGTLANIGDNLTILFFAAGVLIAGALTLIIGVRLRRDWQV